MGKGENGEMEQWTGSDRDGGGLEKVDRTQIRGAWGVMDGKEMRRRGHPSNPEWPHVGEGGGGALTARGPAAGMRGSGVITEALMMPT